MRADDAVRGTLAEGALAPLLGGLQRGRATGVLRVSRMEVRDGVPSVTRLGLRLHRGRVVGFESDRPDDAGLAPPADLAGRASAGLARVLSWPDAVQSWEPATAGTDDAQAPWLAAVALGAVAHLDDEAAVAALGELDRGLRRGALDEEALSVLPSRARVLLPGLRADQSAAELIRGGEETRARDLLTLVSVGAAEWVDRAPAAVSATPAPSAPHPTPPPPVAASTPAPPAPGPESAAMRREIEEAHAATRGATHFAVLGVTPQATTDEIRQAFARLARRYHPDAQRDPAFADLRPKLTDVFVAVSNAYAVLKDAAARTRYEETLAARGRGAGSRFSPAPGGTPPPFLNAADAADQPLESRLLRAQEALAARQPWEAIRLLEEAIPAAAGALKVRAQVLLGRAYGERERPRESEKVLLEALQGDPRCLAACLLLARLYRERGMVKRARSLFERALDIDPDQAEAQRELTSLGGAPPGPGSGSLLSRLRDRR